LPIAGADGGHEGDREEQPCGVSPSTVEVPGQVSDEEDGEGQGEQHAQTVSESASCEENRADE
jgi:hypothetical protein